MISYLKKEIKKNNGVLRLLKSQYATCDGDKVKGYIHELKNNKTLISVATKKPKLEWQSVLVHEYNHLKQKSKKSFAYRQSKFQSGTLKGSYADNVYNEYIFRWSKNFNYSEARLSMRRVLYSEWDCEKLTVLFLKKNNVNKQYTSKYAREANADLFDTIFRLEYRNFKLRDIDIKDQSMIVDSMPDKIMPFSYYLKNFNKYRAFFESCLIVSK